MSAFEVAELIARLVELHTPAVVDELPVQEGPLFARGLKVGLGEQRFAITVEELGPDR